jgi:flagellar hook-basal body complex protein FliE
MSNEAISSILSQIRGLQSQVAPMRAGSESAGVGGVAGAPQGGPGFAATLSNALRQVNEKQADSARIAQAFEMGDPRADLVRVMVASQESQVAFRATVEVRNRLVQAYQDIMNMPL